MKVTTDTTTDGSMRGMGETELLTYLGLLILAGVYRSRGEVATSLCDMESAMLMLRSTM